MAAWRCSGTSNQELITRLFQSGIIKSDRVKQAMLKVDRANYAPANPYHDSPQYIGHNATISAPHMHAHALQTLEPYLNPGARVLDVGSGSGYLTACFAELVAQETGKVTGVEHVQALVSDAEENVKRDGKRGLIDDGVVQFVCGDGREGYPANAPYDCIHVGAAFDGHPEKLLSQLKAPGMLFIPMGPEGGLQAVYVFEKAADGSTDKRALMHVSYVPLTSLKHQVGTTSET